MMAFRTSVNQAPPFLAGVAYGITSAGVIIGKSREADSVQEAIWDVGALDAESGVDLNWISQKRLCLDDLIRIELIEAETIPAAQERRSVPKGSGRSEEVNSRLPRWHAVEGSDLPQLNSPILALEVSINERDPIFAGFENGVVSAMVSFRSGCSGIDGQTARGLLGISGMDISSALHFSWLEEELEKGDFVTIRVVRTADISKAESQGRLVSGMV